MSILSTKKQVPNPNTRVNCPLRTHTQYEENDALHLDSLACGDDQQKGAYVKRDEAHHPFL